MKKPTFRQLKNKGRLIPHEKLKVEGFYYLSPLDPNPTKINVRVWTKWEEIGKISGSWADFADAVPKMIFMRSEVPNPTPGAIVSVAAKEAYRVADVLAPDGLTITATVSLVPENTPYLHDLMYPEDE